MSLFIEGFIWGVVFSVPTCVVSFLLWLGKRS